VSLTAKVKRLLPTVLPMSLLTSNVLSTQATVYKHTKGNTLYVSIPSKMAQDSAFPVKEGDQVEIVWDKKLEAIEKGVPSEGLKAPQETSVAA
jgi:hypothetical protein